MEFNVPMSHDQPLKATCANCRHHVRQSRPHALWFEGEQMRTLDEDVLVYICRAEGENHGKEFLEPVSCGLHAPPEQSKGLADLDARMAAARERWSRKVERDGE